MPITKTNKIIHLANASLVISIARPDGVSKEASVSINHTNMYTQFPGRCHNRKGISTSLCHPHQHPSRHQSTNEIT